ncbi:P22AR C-terminal domain-containing protein [Rodentibacter caecimuris]|uniref:P22AR C-terminal domain-containing protein n=1 Tax=Rodentibacter caecimuris TaxID=1796644 RepID=UPI00258A2765|nr:P22AR C-terminal domain-containing protein [Rodentibacter heylii]
MSNLTILKTSIRDLDNLYSLTDLHKASGSDKKHEPNRFVRNEQTQELIKEINLESSQIAIKSLRTGIHKGTWACEELVLAYAMWISPKFHLIVLRAFLAMHRNEPKQLALPEPEKKFTFEFTEFELETLVWLWFGHKQMNTLLGQLEKPLHDIGSNLHPAVYSHWKEYGRQYKDALETMRRLVQPFTDSDRIGWQRVIHHIQ